MAGKKRKRFHLNPNHISGIFNYCDAWCERCPFTARCAVFAMGEEMEEAPTDRKGASPGLWDDISNSLSDTQDFLAEKAEGQGIDLDAFEVAQYEAEEEKVDAAVRSHRLHSAGQAYMERTRVWLKAVDGWFAGQDRNADRDDIVDVIGWYHTQIHVKLDRALRGEERGVPEIIADFPKDSDGSAKVALLGMDRSLAAWSRLRKHAPEREDEVLEFLIALERLRRATEREFPAARAFVRPGFDDGQTP